ncbi:hypothetical protein HD553DRAFT_323738 [Filobasidium floriforme]|uniref:uncharacterized protein n=1 Tax=Filobasidium floriforme TaxID=5210 RepID=UPI001E8DA175|nr:uncharacterized protein HD553DRAFT_323738 [Filobasidium floriforme]KAH8085159.1 hypothetical protein HD553DRAFT_323738 [Filobasidium floriforme]
MSDNQEYIRGSATGKRIINEEEEDDSVYTGPSVVSSVKTNQTKISFSMGRLKGTIFRLMSSLEGAKSLKEQAMATGTQSQWSSSPVGTYSAPTLGASGLSGTSNDASFAANDAPQSVFEKMDILLQEMTNKLVPLDKIPEQLHVLYRAVQDEVTRVWQTGWKLGLGSKGHGAKLLFASTARSTTGLLPTRGSDWRWEKRHWSTIVIFSKPTRSSSMSSNVPAKGYPGFATIYNRAKSVRTNALALSCQALQGMHNF